MTVVLTGELASGAVQMKEKKKKKKSSSHGAEDSICSYTYGLF
jgi:hypothetical protein